MLATIGVYLVPVFLLYRLVSTLLRLSHIPGPLLNKFTNLPRLLSVYRRSPHDEQVTLHQKYGPVVRLGPNMVSVSGPDYISQIYGIGKGLIKSDFYAVFQNIVNGQRAASLVAMTDESQHAKTKRQIAHAYSLSTLVEFEPLVDSTTEVFNDTLDKNFVQSDTDCDLGRWLQFYAFDVIGELTFSKRLGFIENQEDVSNIIANIGANFDYFSVLGQMPWLDETFLGKSPLYIKLFAKSVSSPILKFAQQLLKERLSEIEEKEEKQHEPTAERQNTQTSNKNSHGKPDFLTRFLQVQKQNDDAAKKGDEEATPMTDRQMLSLLFMNINAGSDTIASTLRAIIYYLLMHQDTMQKLVAEIDAARTSGNLTLPCPTWHETQSEHMPYLRAVIKEGLRLNPALSLPLERTVLQPGLTLTTPSPTTDPGSPDTSRTHKIFLPANTIVGINPYVLHRDPVLFSPDPSAWNPSRWLPEHTSSAQLKVMEASLLTFGAGKRTCLGRNIAMLELHKLLPALLARFEIVFAEGYEGGRRWEVRNSWVLGHEGLVVRLRERHGYSEQVSE